MSETIAPRRQVVGERARVSPALDRTAAVSWRFLVIVAAIAVAVYILVTLRLLVLPVIVGLFLAAILAPPARWLMARGWPRLLATWTVLLAAALIFSGAIALMAPQVADELGELGSRVKRGSEEVLQWAAEGPLNLSRQQIDDYVNQASQQLSEQRSSIAKGALSGAIVAAEVVAALILTLVLAFFYIKDGPAMWRWFTDLLNERHRRDADEMGQRAWSTLGAYVRGTALIALIDAVAVALLLLLLGVPLVVPLTLLTFFGAFFPIIGAFVAGMVAALVALVTVGFAKAAILAAGITILQQVEGDALQPLIMGKALKLHPVVVLLALTAGGIMGGIAGAFLAVPVAAVAAAVAGYLRERPSSA
jgi:putative heme transporter